MAEKATLLQTLPPVAKNTDAKAGPESEAKAEAVTSTEVQSEPGISISPLQLATYGSFILSFVLAGFAAVVIYRKALSKTKESFSGSAKLLAGMLALVSLHGFAATYVYSNYLNRQIDAAPVSLTILIWIIFGAAIGYLGSRLIEKNAKLDTFDAVVDAISYACVYLFATLAVSEQVGPSIALILALVALIAYIVPFSRFLISCKRVKFKRQLTDLRGRQLSLYTQVILPLGIPLAALLYNLELLGAELTLFSINAVTSATVLAASAFMLISMKGASEENENEAGDTTNAQKAEAAPAIDPLVTELLAEEAQLQREADAESGAEPDVVTEFAPKEPARPYKPKVLPKKSPVVAPKAPRKPGAPKKPENHTAKSTPKPDFKVKAPSKPKKRL
jgi:hypothetical protein